MQDFRKLLVWEKSHQVALAIYAATRDFPKEELYGMTSQMRRASISIPSNIAEGCGRGTNGELIRFLQIAMGSASELEYQLLLAHDLKLMDSQSYNILNTSLLEVKRMLNSFIQKLQSARN
ncbi:MAG: four helix bundle protein [Anaerolineae bacterium]